MIHKIQQRKLSLKCSKRHCERYQRILKCVLWNAWLPRARWMCCENEEKSCSYWSVFNVHRKLGNRASDCRSFSEDDTADTIEMCGNHLKYGGHAHMFSSAVHFLFGVTAIFASTKWVTFQDPENKKHDRKGAIFNLQRQWLLYARNRRTFSQNPSLGCL